MAVRLLIYCDDHGHGGAAMATHRLALGLAGRGYDVRYAQTPTEAAAPRIAERTAAGITPVALPYDTIRYYKPSMEDVRTPSRILVEQKPDLVIFSDALVESTLGAKLAAAFLSVPYLSIKHLVLADGLFARDDAMRQQVRRAIAAAAGVIAVSDQNRAILAARFPAEAGWFQTIYNNAPDSFFTPPDPAARAAFRRAHNIPDDAIAVLTAAALVDRKGFHLQAAMLKRLKQAGALDRFVFVWAGEEDGSYFSNLWRNICADGCDGAVRQVGYQKDMAACLDGCDAFLLPSYGEGMPLSLLEAMAKGLPSMVTAVGGCAEAAGDACTLLPDPGQDAEGAVAAMTRTLLSWRDTPAAATRLGQAARERAQALFSSSAILDGYDAAIRRAVFAAGDYISPGLPLHKGEWDMPFIAPAPAERLTPAQRACPHTHYADTRFPRIPVIPVTRDECLVLHAAARQFAGRRALDASYSFGWVLYHLLSAGMIVDTVDYFLSHPELMTAAIGTLPPALGSRLRVVGGPTDQVLTPLIGITPNPWPLVVVDLRRPGNHAAMIENCIGHMAADAMLFLLGLGDPACAAAGQEILRTLKEQGWRIGQFQTANSLSLAWRGGVTIPPHFPDPALRRDA